MNIDERLIVQVGDITKLQVDAIVNAANNSLLGGGGVDGAIHRAAGPQLLEECRGIGGCPTGEARIMKGYQLPAKHVIATVGPVYRDGNSNEPELLKSCYLQTLTLAARNDVQTIAYPAISTGIYGYPKLDAARIAVGTTRDFLRDSQVPGQVIFCCFSESDAAIYRDILETA